jgi:hypothetical protein
MSQLPPEDLIEGALRYLRCVAPESLPDRVKITVGTERLGEIGHVYVPLTRTLPPPGAPDATPPPRAREPVLNEMEQDILAALGAETLTGQEVADRAGYPYESNFRLTLASMRRRGLLAGNAGDRGYCAASPAAPTP